MRPMDVKERAIVESFLARISAMTTEIVDIEEIDNVLSHSRDFMSGWNTLVECAGKLAIESRSFRLSMASGLPRHIIIASWVYLST